MSQVESEAKLQSIFTAIDGSEAMFRHVEKRLTSLELTISALETERAVSDEKRKFMEARFGQIDRRLEKIEGHMARLVWLIIAAILGGFMSFVMQNGALGV